MRKTIIMGAAVRDLVGELYPGGIHIYGKSELRSNRKILITNG